MFWWKRSDTLEDKALNLVSEKMVYELDKSNNEEKNIIKVTPSKFQFIHKYKFNNSLIFPNKCYEYKFENTRILKRCLSYYKMNEYGTVCYISDNVVLESEISKWYQQQKFDSRELSEILKECQQMIEWHDWKSLDSKIFIMKLHPELFNKLEFRKYVRTELERIIKGFNKINEEAKQIGADLIFEKEFGGYYSLVFPENTSREVIEKFHSNFSSDPQPTHSLTYLEFEKFDQLKLDLKKYLED